MNTITLAVSDEGETVAPITKTVVVSKNDGRAAIAGVSRASDRDGAVGGCFL